MTAIRHAVEEFAKKVPPHSVLLDVGCGSKPYKDIFNQSNYIGIDVEKSGRTEKNPDLFFDGKNIPFDECYFDVVICTQVLEHCMNPDLLIREMYRVLKRSGKILLTVPFIWGEHEVPYDFRRYSTFGVRQLFESAGFKTVEITRLVTGVDALAMLIDSEINYFNVHLKNGVGSRGNGIRRRLLEKVMRYVYPIQLKLWRKLYLFDRIYIDNMVIAHKE